MYPHPTPNNKHTHTHTHTTTTLNLQHNAIPWVKPDSILIFGGIDSSSGKFGPVVAPTVLEIHGVCPGGCEAQGTFNNGRCDCNLGWSGERCETFQPSKINNASDAPCLNDCSGQGVCINGGCVCHKGFNGTDCSRRIDCPNCPGRDAGCPNDCSGHGACQEPAFAAAGALTEGAGIAHKQGTKKCHCASGLPVRTVVHTCAQEKSSRRTVRQWLLAQVTVRAMMQMAAVTV